ncbi:hypothetical protein ACFLXC_03105 [Chloroflexota bacterium]
MSNVAVLKQHYDKMQSNRQSLNLSPITDDKLVFCKYNGEPYLPDMISQYWHKIAKRTGLNIRLHDSRHSHDIIDVKAGSKP